MTFKKDYINYLLYTVVNSPGSEFKENYRLSKLVDSIIAIDDVMKVTFIVGKTAGLDLLFKYLLYISDKIDKSQVTIFNLKDNFDYDRINIAKICAKIDLYKSENVQEAIKEITEEDKAKTEDPLIEKTGDKKDTIKIDITDEGNVPNLIEMDGEAVTAAEEDESESGLTLIENTESYTGEAEVFELESLSESVENSDKLSELNNSAAEEEISGTENTDVINADEEAGVISTEEIKETEEIIAEIEAENEINDDTTAAEDELPEIEIEVHKPKGTSPEDEHVKEEAITNEAYYTFESRFFEEV
ncbi:MAG: hypothetical protein IAE93_09580, partial [Ignavibacteria bacterium]|nr:hypothetical protein [Ignavibacteria bacterium]